VEVIAPLLPVRDPRHGGRPLEYNRGLVPDTILSVVRTERVELVVVTRNADVRASSYCPAGGWSGDHAPGGPHPRVRRL
jgi:hypothetical protein